MADEAGGLPSPTRAYEKMVPEKVRLHMAVTALQFCYAGQHIILSAAVDMGVSKLVFPVYRNLTALLLLVPFAYFLERKDRPPLTLSLVVQFFFMGLIGITGNQMLYLLGLENTSATFASAMENSVPAITFLMAALFGIEQVHLNRKDGIAKVLGTLLSVAGALVIVLYKGPTIYGSTPSTSQHLNQSDHFMFSLSGHVGETNWTLGCVYLIGHCLCWSTWIVLQAPVLKKYPARLTVSSYTSFFGILQCSAIAGILERDFQAWKVNSGVEVFAILYTGVMTSAIAFAIQIWAIERGGPVFVSVYLPQQTLLVAMMDSLILGEQFYLGGIIGAVLIIAGLYLVVWGKNEERKFCTKEELIQPLLSSSSR